MARTYSLPTTRPAGKRCPPADHRRSRHGLLGLRVAGSPALPNVERSCSVAEGSRQACEERQFWRGHLRRPWDRAVGSACVSEVDQGVPGWPIVRSSESAVAERAGPSWLVRAVPGLILGVGLIAMAAAMLLAARSGVNPPVSKECRSDLSMCCWCTRHRRRGWWSLGSSPWWRWLCLSLVLMRGRRSVLLIRLVVPVMW